MDSALERGYFFFLVVLISNLQIQKKIPLDSAHDMSFC